MKIKSQTIDKSIPSDDLLVYIYTLLTWMW